MSSDHTEKPHSAPVLGTVVPINNREEGGRAPAAVGTDGESTGDNNHEGSSSTARNNHHSSAQTVSVPFCTKLGLLKTVIPTIMLAGLTLGLPITTLPQLMHKTYGRDEFTISGIFGGIQGFVALIFGPIVGALSDKYGRKPLLLFCLAWYSLRYVAYVVSGNNFWAFSIANAISGYTSGIVSLTIAIAIEMIPMGWASIQPAILSYMIGLYLIGAAVGPMIGTFLGAPKLFYVGLGVALIVIPVAHWTVPKDHKNHMKDVKSGGEQEEEEGEGAQPVVNEQSPLVSGGQEEKTLKWHQEVKRAVSRLGQLMRRNPQLRLVTLEIWLNQMADQMTQGLLLLYLNDHFTDFTSRDQLIFFAVFAFGAIVGLFFVVVQLKKFFGTLNTLRIALIFNMIGIGGYGLVQTKWQAYALALTGMISVGVYPTAAALITGVTLPQDLGAAQGIGGGARMLAEGLSPFIFGLLLQQFKGTTMPGAPFVIAGFFCFVACALTFWLEDLDPMLTEGRWVKAPKRRLRKKKQQEQ